MRNDTASLLQVLSAAEQHLDYMRRSLASETGRYTVGEHDQLYRDIQRVWDFAGEMEKQK